MAGVKVLCFQHCTTDYQILCLSLPSHCPVCRECIFTSTMKVPPFEVRCPFVNAHDYPCSVVIKPTHGTFFSDYSNNSNLHIGVTNSQGVVYEYDQQGLTVGSRDWEQCLALPVLRDTHAEHALHYDVTLEHMRTSGEWTSGRYASESFNCYDFVLAFLEEIKPVDLPLTVLHKDKFSELFIQPQIKEVTRYLGLYRKIVSQGCACVVQPCSTDL